MTDFEPGLIKAIKDQFPSTTHTGCFLHHTQAVFKKANSLGLSGDYKRDADVRSCVRKLMSLPLLPVYKIKSAFQYLANDHRDCLDPLFPRL
ncbi:unnamed protein product, partial [Adineta ricciae]